MGTAAGPRDHRSERHHAHHGQQTAEPPPMLLALHGKTIA
jgi:hypothetical protein